MAKSVLTRKELSERWGVDITTLIRYEKDNVIKPLPLPTPRYSLSMILEIEGSGIDSLSPLERRRLKNKLQDLEEENKRLKQMILEVNGITQKIYKEIV